MTSVHLQQWIQHPEQLNRDTLYEIRTLLARYPYFQSLRLLYLKNLYLLHDPDFGAELRRSVLYVADRRVLFHLIEGELRLWRNGRSSLHTGDNEMQEEPGIDRTLFLINAFLAEVPEERTSQPSELDYTVDYTAYLLREDAEAEGAMPEAPRLRGQELIDGFIQKSEAVGQTLKEDIPFPEAQEAGSALPENKGELPDTPVTGEGEELDDGYFTETLAKIYIKQHRYEKALEIIKKLSLNYPKKSAYFADQIKTLEDLIINAKSK